MALRVLVTGATGNLGTSLVPLLAADERIGSVLAVSRRAPEPSWQPGPGVEHRRADLVSDTLEPLLEGVDVVVNLAWQIQPSRDVDALWRTNVIGTGRLLDACGARGVPSVVHASSLAAYSADTGGGPVTEDAPTHGLATHPYSWQKAYAERLLDRFELVHPAVRVVRFRPTLLFKREAAAEMRELFLGPVMPGPLARPQLSAVLAALPPRFQVMHTDDAATAFHSAVVRRVRGAFNLATAAVYGTGAAHKLTRPLFTGVARAAWKLHLVPADPGWIDLMFRAPLLDSAKARRELDWSPRWSGEAALQDLLAGFRADAEGPTASLRGDPSPAPGPDPATREGPSPAG